MVTATCVVSSLQGLYQMFWLFLILYGLPQFFSEYELPTQGSTAPGYLSYAGVMTQRLPKDIPPLTGASTLPAARRLTNMVQSDVYVCHATAR